MWISKRILAAALAAAVAAISLALAVGAVARGGSGDGDGSPSFEHSVAPSLPTDPAFHGVNPGGVPWVLAQGEARINEDGLDLRVEGLVIPKPAGNGTAGQVMTISASLFCGADSGAVAAETSRQAKLSINGDGRIRDGSFDLPASCLAPIVVVHPNGNTTTYIAVDGWRP